jgi:hypothetical protein
LKGHGFSRAATKPVKSRALAPEETAGNAPDSVTSADAHDFFDAMSQLLFAAFWDGGAYGRAARRLLSRLKNVLDNI